MKPIECFLIERSETCRRFLRRHVRAQDALGPTCARGWHEASTILDRLVATDAQAVTIENGWPKNDPRWPRACERCDYLFRQSDIYELFYEREWTCAGTGNVYTIRAENGWKLDADAAPIGAMWDADWFHELTPWRGADGKSLTVRTPGGDWMIDGPVSRESQEQWKRSGHAPKVTVDGVFSRRRRRPPWRDYEGVLQDGLLRELAR